MKEIVIAWKALIGIDPEDKVWDKIHFARCLRSAKLLLEVFDGDEARAIKCVKAVYADLHDFKGLTVTIETVVKHAHAYKQKEADSPAEREKRKKARWAAEGLTACCGAQMEIWDDGKTHCKNCNRTLTITKVAELPDIKFKAI